MTSAMQFELMRGVGVDSAGNDRFRHEGLDRSDTPVHTENLLNEANFVVTHGWSFNHTFTDTNECRR